MVSKKYQCRYCDFKTTKAGYRWKHEKRMHNNKPTLKKKDDKVKRCDYCYFENTKSSSIKVHISRVHMRGEGFKCIYCRYSTSEKDNLMNHFEIHRELRAKLTYVKISTNNQSTILPNVSSNVQETSKEITQINDNNTSINKQKKEDEIKKCKHCNYSTSNIVHLRTHVEGVHLKIKKYKCKRCVYSSYNISNVVQHLKSVHLGIEKIKCPYCKYVTDQERYLERHIQNKHNNELKCSNCDYKTFDKIILREHINDKHYLDKQLQQSDVKIEESLDNSVIMMINTSIPGSSSSSHFQITSEENLSTIKIEEDDIIENEGIGFECKYYTMDKEDLKNHFKNCQMEIEMKSAPFRIVMMNKEENPATIKTEEITIDDVILPLEIKDESKNENETTTIKFEKD